MTRWVKVSFGDVAKVVGGDGQGIGFVTLCHEATGRAMGILLDKWTLHEVLLRRDSAGECAKQLPEVLYGELSSISTAGYSIRIAEAKDGEYKAELVAGDAPGQCGRGIKAGDAVVLSLLSGMDIFVNEELLSLPGNPIGEGYSRVPMPISAVDSDTLRKGLGTAIRDEDYEQASNIRDELRRRGLPAEPAEPAAWEYGEEDGAEE